MELTNLWSCRRCFPLVSDEEEEQDADDEGDPDDRGDVDSIPGVPVDVFGLHFRDESVEFLHVDFFGIFNIFEDVQILLDVLGMSVRQKVDFRQFDDRPDKVPVVLDEGW